MGAWVEVSLARRKGVVHIGLNGRSDDNVEGQHGLAWSRFDKQVVRRYFGRKIWRWSYGREGEDINHRIDC